MKKIRAANRSAKDRTEFDAQLLLAAIRNRTGGLVDEVLGKYLLLFLSDTKSRLDAMSAAERDGNLELVGRQCHAIKGASLEFGIIGMEERCNDVRRTCRNGGRSALPGAIGDLVREFEKVRPVFETAISSSFPRESSVEQ